MPATGVGRDRRLSTPAHRHRNPEPPGTERTPRVVAARKLLRRAGRDRAGRFLVEGAQAVREALRRRDGARAVRHGDGRRAASGAGRGRARGRRPGPPGHRPGRGGALGHRHPAGPLRRLRPPRRARPGRARRAARPRRGAGRRRGPGQRGHRRPRGRRRGRRCRPARGRHRGPAQRQGGAGVHRQRLPPSARPRPRRGRRARGLPRCRAHPRWSPTAAASWTCTTRRAAAVLAGPTAWVFGGEAHGLAPELAAAADHRVRVPIHGRAESLNLATAAAVCLYASAQASRTG